MAALLAIAAMVLVTILAANTLAGVIISTCKGISWFLKQRAAIVIPGTLAWAASTLLLVYWVGNWAAR
jgi:hypothetical protein